MNLSAQHRPRWRSGLPCALVFLFSFLFLFLGMDRGFDFYDEGLNLVAAMRVAAGQAPHRDFYANYGPAQCYMLAWLFHFFGSSILVERVYDLLVRSAIVAVTYAIAAAYCRRWVAACTTFISLLWLFSAGLPSIAYPILPVLLLVMISSILLLPRGRGEVGRWRSVLAGATSGLVILFRYDVGFALAAVHVAFMLVVASLRRREAGAESGGKAWPAPGFYLLGTAVIFLPPALLFLSVSPAHPFVHDVLLYPAKYYARARRLPFPGIRWRSLENLAVYLPVAVTGLCLYTIVSARRRGCTLVEGPRPCQERIRFLFLFGMLTLMFYFKGFVRISVGQMLLAIVLATVALAVLLEHTAGEQPRLHRLSLWTMTFLLFTAVWSGLKEVRVLYLSRESVLQDILQGPAALPFTEAGCNAIARLRTGLCFAVDPYHAQAIAYLLRHSQPSEPIFIGLNRHDRLVSNDLLTYFLADRLPATRWAHFDPDLQTRADIQSEMIRELDSQRVRYVVLESQYETQLQPWNDSSKSSGVTLLDDYIRKTYHPIETYGPISIWLRDGHAS